MDEDELSVEQLHRRYYRWWTIRVMSDAVKLGPLTVCWYRWFDHRWKVDVCWLGWPVLSTLKRS